MRTVETSVLVVGGGSAGLYASSALALLGVDTYLVNDRAETSSLPKAHLLSQRTMELFDAVGVSEQVSALACPAEHMAATGWYAGVAGDHDHYGRRLGRIEAWGAGYTDPDYVSASAFAPTNLPQSRLEPILRTRAEELAPGRVLFGHRLVSLAQDETGVDAVVRDLASEEDYRVRATYVVGADGGRTVGELVGIGTSGSGPLMNLVSVHFAADLTDWLDDDDDVFIRWLVNPDHGGSWASGVLMPMGPEEWGTRSSQWAFHLLHAIDDDGPPVRDQALERMMRTLGIPDFAPQIDAVSIWTMEGAVADRYRADRVFLVGDAAHRCPPTGGLGMNAGLQDVDNLVWKLAAVVGASAGVGLLETYEAERRPVGLVTVERSIENAMSQYSIDEALGLSADRSSQENWNALRPLWEDLPGADDKRGRLAAAIARQTREFHHLNLDLGHRYESTAVIGDGSEESDPLDPVRLHEPSTRPGRRVPHAFVQHHGDTVALARLIGPGRFLLLAGERGHDWVDAGERVAKDLDLALDCFIVGQDGGDLLDLRSAWLRQRQIGPEGAVLVRPDGVVAFRSLGYDPDPDPQTVLGQALCDVLDREVS